MTERIKGLDSFFAPERKADRSLSSFFSEPQKPSMRNQVLDKKQKKIDRIQQRYEKSSTDSHRERLHRMRERLRHTTKKLPIVEHEKNGEEDRT